MHNVKHAKGQNWCVNEDAIRDACRANPDREPRGNVTFEGPLKNGDYRATLVDTTGNVLTVCEVDEYDI